MLFASVNRDSVGGTVPESVFAMFQLTFAIITPALIIGGFAVAMEWIRYGKPSVLGIATGTIAGLGTITPASGFVGPMGGIIIGATAGVMCFFATQFLKRSLHVDDSLDVAPVHGVGGAIGTVLTGVFVATSIGGAGFADGMNMGKQLAVQLLGVGAAIAWCGLLTFVILKILDVVLGLRVTEEHETEGWIYRSTASGRTAIDRNGGEARVCLTRVSHSAPLGLAKEPLAVT